MRWFPAMVSNHVKDLIERYGWDSKIPSELTDYVKVRKGYDYKDHSRVGAKHGEWVSDEVCDRFCVIGSGEQCIAKLRELEEVGVDQFNIYLMTDGQEATLEAYGRDIMPQFSGVAAWGNGGVTRISGGAAAVGRVPGWPAQNPSPTRVLRRRLPRDHTPLRRGRDRGRRPARRLPRRRARQADRRHGPVRSGKSTLMHILAGARPADRWLGRDRRRRLANLSDTDMTRLRRKHIGFVFQFFNLLPMLTAEENVAPAALGRRREARPDVVRGSSKRSASPTAASTARPSSRAASSSASRSRARSSPGRRSCSPTSRRATSTRRRAPRSSSCCALRRASTGRRW